MKAILGLVMLFLSSCQLPFLINAQGYEEKHMGLDEAWRIVSAMEYKKGDGYINSPSEFFRNKEGNCLDFSVGMVYLLGPEASVLTVRMNGSETNHAIVLYHGYYIEPQTYLLFYQRDSFELLNTYSYSSIMSISTLYGLKSL